MKDEFSSFGRLPTGPATAAEMIVPDDIQKLDFATRGLYVGTGGDISVEMLAGEHVLLRNLQPGVMYPLRVVQIFAAGTTASDLVGLR